MTSYSVTFVEPTVIGTAAYFTCCSNASMMASIESLNRPVASALESKDSDDQWPWSGLNGVLPRQPQLPEFDVILWIVVSTTTNPEVRRYLISADGKFG